ncbi:MAG: TonB-dependent receptor plug domain-containing protein [Treponema sp.]|nr:TonB-dependent receptor plug domain-containing protein [Treponema sp.]
MQKLNIFFFITLFFLAVSPLFAREVTIFVIDSDLELPLEGAVIRTRDGNEYICDNEGKALIEAPANRQLIVQAFYPGYETGIISIPVSGSSFTIHLRLSGVLQGRELVLEAPRPGSNESRTGRSIALGSREISQTAEIGIVEDVMNTIKLLPGVNYSGTFNAQPSIRGGYPGDMGASMDGFFISNPYFWGGGFSIFDPRMVQSAQLSHGVFSTRYGHTISGLLEITTRSPSPTEILFDFGFNTSMASFSLSLPLFGKGGILFTGRVTYYDPVIALAKELSPYIPDLSRVNYIRQAPFIRTVTANGNYRFTDNLELISTFFFGVDGVGVFFANPSSDPNVNDSSVDFDFTNYQGFLTSSLLWNPRPDMLLKVTLGAGYEDRIIYGEMDYNLRNRYFSSDFSNNPNYSTLIPLLTNPYNFYEYSLIDQTDSHFNLQGRIDLDWEISNNFLLSAGIQEMFNWHSSKGDQRVTNETLFQNLSLVNQSFLKIMYPSISESVWNYVRIAVPIHYSPDTNNYLFTTSAYILCEYDSENRLKAELGLRLDHFYLTGSGFSLSSDPVLNPRLNIDFNIAKDFWIFKSIDISAGTGLFSSINDNIIAAEERYNINRIKPNRSWTSILGLRLEFPESLYLNIEGYYKYVFDRMYIPLALTIDNLDILPNFDGEGIVWGIDVMLHKVQSRFIDGWLSYSFNWTKYRDPAGRYGGRGLSGGNRGDSWYFPAFHRFHNLNLVVNIKPALNMNFYIRFGLASGVPLPRRYGDAPQSYPVLLLDQNKFIEKFYWPSYIDDSNRTTFSLPLDFKFSIYGSNRNGKTRYEIYAAVENILAFVYTAQGNTRFNPYSGQIDSGNSSANYEIPMPIPSFGFKFSY